MIELKLFLDNVNLCFHAIIKNKNDFEVIYDLNDAYTPLLIEALNGTFHLDYLEDNTKKTFLINEHDYQANLEKFIIFFEKFFNLKTSLIKK
jgi:hypothetical protein